MLIPLSALAAFRQDVAAAPDAATPADARWLQVATLLQSAVDVPRAARSGILDAVAVLATPEPVASDDARAPLPITLSASLPRAIEIALRLGVAMEDSARFHLAYATFDAVLRLIPSEIGDPRARTELQGVVLALQGRVARQLGDSAAAREWYEAAEAIGRESGDGSVLARAWVGYGVLAQIRGNMPEARKWFTQVLSQPAAVRESTQVAHQALMAAAAAAGDYATAAEHGWSSYELAIDHDDAAAALCDLSQVMLDSGRPRLALRGFSAAMLKAPSAPRRSLPALGGAAIAAAEALGQEGIALIHSFHDDAEAVMGKTHLPFQHALALADFGDAYAIVGDAANTSSLRDRARQLAQTYGFFEILYRVTEGARPVASGADRRSGTSVPVTTPKPINGAEPVLDSLASFRAAASVEDALAAVSR